MVVGMMWLMCGMVCDVVLYIDGSRCAYTPDIRVGCKLHVDLHERFVGGYDWLTGDFDTLAFCACFFVFPFETYSDVSTCETRGLTTSIYFNSLFY